MPLLDADACERLIREVPRSRRSGMLTQVVGLLLECRGLQSAQGELCALTQPDGSILDLEVVGFRGPNTLLMPLGEASGLRPGARIRPMGKRLEVQTGDFLLGRMLDGLGRPLDGGPPLPAGRSVPLDRKAPTPFERKPISESMPTGVAAIDGFLTLGRGQRMGIFAGSGVGKSTLLADVARETLADINVIAMVGERGREVRHFIEEALGEEGLRRSVLVVATSDAPPLIRLKACFTAMAIAESFRDQGQDVMLMLDSVTRLAGAVREIGLALGEPPTVKGYPPSFFSTMPKVVERMGRTERGSITGILTVLVDGDDMNDPVADTMRGLLDGHIVLSREIAHRGVFPAIDVLASASRVMGQVTSVEHRNDALELRSLLAGLEESRDLVAVGAYEPGSDARIDRALAKKPELEALLKQSSREIRPFDTTVMQLRSMVGGSS